MENKYNTILQHIGVKTEYGLKHTELFYIKSLRWQYSKIPNTKYGLKYSNITLSHITLGYQDVDIKYKLEYTTDVKKTQAH